MKNNGYTRVMFHATHEDNAQSIMEYGLLPKYATGKRKAVWFVPKNGIETAILHVAARHNWRVSEMIVITVIAVSDDVKYSGNGMMFYSVFPEPCESVAPAITFLSEVTEDEE